MELGDSFGFRLDCHFPPRTSSLQIFNVGLRMVDERRSIELYCNGYSEGEHAAVGGMFVKH